MFGVVDEFFPDKYGFIEAEGGGRYFFSIRSVIGEISQGDKVEFSTEDDIRRKPGDVIAVNVQRIGAPAVEEEPCRLHVSQLPLFCTSEDLRTCFEQIGPVLSAGVVIDSAGNSRGYGFVRMKNPKDALQAVCDFHLQPWGDRIIRVEPSVRNAPSSSTA